MNLFNVDRVNVLCAFVSQSNMKDVKRDSSILLKHNMSTSTQENAIVNLVLNVLESDHILITVNC